MKILDFNSHAHVERDWYWKMLLVSILHFNSHAHVERDRVSTNLSYSYLYFNSHAHVERDDYTTGAGTAIVFNFNSHAHVERDHLILKPVHFMTISTHTLTWSVTVLENVASIDFTFQLTRSRGA